VAIIIETGAKGNLASTVLTSAIMKDIIIIIAFTASLSLFGTAKSEASILGVIIEETFSIIAGIGAGLVLITYVRHVRQNRGVFLLMFTAIITWLAGEIHLNPLLTFLAAGITVNNFSIFGKSLVQDVENNSQIIYLVFFFLAGALIDMDALSRMWLLAVFIVILRAATMHAGCYASSYMVKCGRKAMTLSSLGFIGQAGVSIGFAKIIGANFPGWGEDFRTMLLAVVAINQIIGPVGFKWALKKAGEIKG
jgi:Kef-type K+ transport system membrane component KefB